MKKIGYAGKLFFALLAISSAVYADNKVKYIYFVQDMPLPCNITMLEYKISFESLER